MTFPFKPLQIGSLEPRIPLIQGGMAIRISMAPLAGAVARAGGIGLIAASGLEHDELRSEICKARELAGSEGIIGINIMVAANDFKNIVHVAMDAGIDLIVVGAGFSRDVFEWGITRNVPIVPIVSSAKLAKISEKLGASAIIVEGTEAGGHLGTDRSTWDVIPEVLDAVSVPVIAAGGIFSGDEFVKMMNLGVSGIQMATRFGASVESSAAMEWKQKYIEAKTPEEIVKIMSPVGLPGRAIVNTEFTRKILAGPVEIESCDNCLRKCSHTFCIILSLINAQQGDVENGIVFAGSNAWRVNEVKTTEEIINDLGNEIDEYISSKN